MPQENVAVVRRVVIEFAETQQLSELIAPDLVWDMGSWSAWPPEASRVVCARSTFDSK